MADVVTVRIAGLSELGERMRGLAKDVQDRGARQATGAAAQVVRGSVKKRIRSNPSVDSGLLEQNVIVKKVPKSQTALTSEHIVTVRKKDYPPERGKARRNTKQVAIYKEFGTVKMPKEPFLGPGFDRSKARAAEVMAARLDKAITKAGR